MGIPISGQQGSFAVTNDFTFTVKTDNTGTSNNDQFKIPVYSSGSYDCIVFWGDGTSDVITTWNDSSWTHTFPSAGTYTIRIEGTFTGFRFNNSGDRLKLTQISRWGGLKLGNANSFFYGCSNLVITATDQLNLDGASDLSSAFRDCTSITSIPYIYQWDISGVTNMTNIFNGVTLSTSSYDELLIGWESQTVQNSINFHGGNSKYTLGNSLTARYNLTQDHSWTITDGGDSIGTLTGWYDGYDASTVTESSGDVSSWADKSGNGYDLAQSTGVNKPSYISDGNPHLHFDGVSHFLEGTALSNLVTASEYTIFIVLSPEIVDDTASNAYSLPSPLQTSTGFFGLTVGDDVYYQYNWDGNADYSTQPAVVDENKVLIMKHESGNLRLRKDDSSFDVNASGDTTSIAGLLRVGFKDDYFKGKIYEIIFYNSSLSDSNVNAVKAILDAKWGF